MRCQYAVVRRRELRTHEEVSTELVSSSNHRRDDSVVRPLTSLSSQPHQRDLKLSEGRETDLNTVRVTLLQNKVTSPVLQRESTSLRYLTCSKPSIVGLNVRTGVPVLVSRREENGVGG
jgi:hypothetical protein